MSTMPGEYTIYRWLDGSTFARVIDRDHFLSAAEQVRQEALARAATLWGGAGSNPFYANLTDAHVLEAGEIDTWWGTLPENDPDWRNVAFVLRNPEGQPQAVLTFELHIGARLPKNRHPKLEQVLTTHPPTLRVPWGPMRGQLLDVITEYLLWPLADQPTNRFFIQTREQARRLGWVRSASDRLWKELLHVEERYTASLLQKHKEASGIGRSVNSEEMLQNLVRHYVPRALIRARAGSHTFPIDRTSTSEAPPNTIVWSNETLLRELGKRDQNTLYLRAEIRGDPPAIAWSLSEETYTVGRAPTVAQLLHSLGLAAPRSEFWDFVDAVAIPGEPLFDQDVYHELKQLAPIWETNDFFRSAAEQLGLPSR